MRLGLAAFIIYLPILAVILGWLAPKKYPGFSFKTHWISNLGEKKSKSYPWFTVGLRLLSFLGLFFVLNFNRSPLTFLAGLGILFSIFLATLFPMDIKLTAHMGTACLLFFFLIVFNLTLLPQLSPLIFLEIILLALLTLASGLFYRKYPLSATADLVNVMKKERSPLIRSVALLEWLIFANQAIWLFLMGIALL